MITNARTAEMCKLTENSFRDVNIAFANELIRLANRYPRVNILQPGPGVGGHCIAVDPWFIVSKTPEEARLIRTAREVNDSKPEWVINKAKQAVAEYLMENPDKTAKDVTIACFGLAFKPDIDDLRESPALAITQQIAATHPGPVLAVEPNIRALPASLEGRLRLVAQQEAEQYAAINVLLVDHQQFRSASTTASQSGSVIDTRGIWSA